MRAMTSLDVSRLVGKEYVPMAKDVIRMVTIQVTIQFLLAIGGDGVAFLTQEFMLLLVYIVIGVALYWMVIRRVVNVV